MRPVAAGQKLVKAGLHSGSAQSAAGPKLRSHAAIPGEAPSPFISPTRRVHQPHHLVGGGSITTIAAKILRAQISPTGAADGLLNSP